MINRDDVEQKSRTLLITIHEGNYEDLIKLSCPMCSSQLRISFHRSFLFFWRSSINAQCTSNNCEFILHSDFLFSKPIWVKNHGRLIITNAI